MNFSQDSLAEIEGLTSGKSRFLQDEDCGKGTTQRAAELCGIALKEQHDDDRMTESARVLGGKPLNTEMKNCCAENVLSVEGKFAKTGDLQFFVPPYLTGDLPNVCKGEIYVLSTHPR